MTTKKKLLSVWENVREKDALNSFSIEQKGAQRIREVKIGKLVVRCEVGSLRKEFLSRGRWKFVWDVEVLAPRVDTPRYVFCGDAPSLEEAKRCVDVALVAIRVIEVDAVIPPRRKKR